MTLRHPIACLLVALPFGVAPAKAADPTTPAPSDSMLGLSVPNPVPCPKIELARVDPPRLVAKGPLAGLRVDPEKFLRADVTIADAVAILGRPALCNRAPASGFLDLHLAPTAPNVRRATLETYDDELIGIQVELTTPVVVDIVALGRALGPADRVPGPMDAFEAGGNAYTRTSDAYRGQLMFMHRATADPETAWQVHEIIFRRTALLELLPDAFHSADDVARLVALVMRPQTPEPVALYGTLGAVARSEDDPAGPPGHLITLADAAAQRNIVGATIRAWVREGRDRTRAVHVGFAVPIVASPAELARAIAARLHSAAASPIAQGAQATFALDAGGVAAKVTVRLAGGTVVALDLERGAPVPRH